MHWADRSTCDLLSFLVRNIRQARVLLVVTFRSDELNRNDLLRPLLAGLARAEGVSRLELARLSRAQAAVQLEGILGRPPEAALISEVYQRGGGIPLAHRGPGGLRRHGRRRAAGVRCGICCWPRSRCCPSGRSRRCGSPPAGGARLSHLLLAAVTGLG